MNYAYNLRLNNHLFRYNNQNASLPHYYNENQVSLQNFVNIPKPAIDYRLKGGYLDAYSLLECVAYYSRFREAETYQKNPSLNLHHGFIYIEDNRLVDLSWLYVMYLEKTFHLSNGFKALVENNNLSVKKVFRLFARPEIQDEIKQEIFVILQKHKVNHRDKSSTALYTEKEVAKLLVDKMAFAFHSRLLNEEDARFWIRFSHSHDNWKKAWEASAFFEKLFPVKEHEYKPWLVVIRAKLLAIENTGNHKILTQAETPRLAERIFSVMQWLCQNKHRNLLIWLLTFLFQENSTDTKRPYLFLHGPPNSGKTFFMNMLAPPSNAQDSFLVKNRTFAHFGSEKHGDYELHMLIFDDPGDAKGKPNQLDTSVILNLANNNYTHNLPVKFGFMNLKKGQIAIISNQNAAGMFPPESLQAIKSRLLTIEFAKTDPFPLQGESHLSKPFLYNDTFAYNVNEIMPNPAVNFIELEEEEEEENDDGDNFGFNHHHIPQTETFDQDILFYILWRAIFKILKDQLALQTLSTLKYYVPNQHFRTLIRNKQVNCIYEIICQRLTEQDLLKLLL